MSDIKASLRNSRGETLEWWDNLETVEEAKACASQWATLPAVQDGREHIAIDDFDNGRTHFYDPEEGWEDTEMDYAPDAVQTIHGWEVI